MNGPPDKGVEVLYSVQASYKLYQASSGVGTCDDVIKVPLADVAPRQTVIDKGTYVVIPVVEIIPNVPLTVKLVTNEGVTVEPLYFYRGYPYFVYGAQPFYLVLPPRTSGIKHVVIDNEYGLKTSLVFDIMPPPYNYENALFGVITGVTQYQYTLIKNVEKNVSVLDTKVVILEDKTNALKLVADTQYFSDVKLPKGAGKQSITIEDGMLYFSTAFFYPSTPEETVHKPTITLFDGSYNHSFVLSITESPQRLNVDLVAGMIYVSSSSTGEIKQQFKTPTPEHGFKKISFEGYDDILSSVLNINIDGRRVV